MLKYASFMIEFLLRSQFFCFILLFSDTIVCLKNLPHFPYSDEKENHYRHQCLA